MFVEYGIAFFPVYLTLDESIALELGAEESMECANQEEFEKILEKILNYMELASEIMGIRLFILCNIKSYLDYKQLTYLYEQAFYKKYHLLLIESHCSAEKNNIENTIIIDQDNCIIS